MGTKRIQLSGVIETTAGSNCWPEPPDFPPQYSGGPYLGASGDPTWDLEARNLTDPDLSKAGWIVQLQNAPYTVLTRNGDVTAVSHAAPPGKYNSTLVGGTLVMQGPSAGGLMQIYRQSDGLPHTYEYHVWTSNVQNGNSDYCFIANGPNYNTNGTTFFYTGLEGSADRHSVILRVQGTAGAPIVNQYANDVMPDWHQDLVRYIRVHADNLQTEVKIGDPTGRVVIANPTTVDNTPVPNYAGVWLNAVVDHVVYIDFIRRKPENQYP